MIYKFSDNIIQVFLVTKNNVTVYTKQTAYPTCTPRHFLGDFKCGNYIVFRLHALISCSNSCLLTPDTKTHHTSLLISCNYKEMPKHINIALTYKNNIILEHAVLTRPI